MPTDWFCPNPWEWLDVVIDQKELDKVAFSVCTQCWANSERVLCDATVAELAEPDFYRRILERGNSPTLREVRRCILDQTVPGMCAECPKLAERYSPVLVRSEVSDPFHRDILDRGALETPGPSVINLCYDPSCNLACPMCRSHPMALGPADELYQYLDAFQQHTMMPLLKSARTAFFSAYGDPFGSRLYQAMLRELTPENAPALRLYLLTNGLGLTPEKWREFPLLDAGRVDTVNVSIDAASAETYQVMRGGNWHLLQDNLAHLAVLRCTDQLPQLTFGFVCRAVNFRDLPAFARMAADHHATLIHVYALMHTGPSEWDDEFYRREAVHLPDHPDHAEFQRCLAKAEAVGVPMHLEVQRLPDIR